MAHNFIKGIDWIADATGNTPLGGHAFVSKSGSDATVAGNNPNTPYLTITAALAAGYLNVIIGTGGYTEINLNMNAGITLKGDGEVYLIDPAVNTNVALTNWGGTKRDLVEDIIFSGYLTNYGISFSGNIHRGNVFLGNTFIGGNITDSHGDIDSGFVGQIQNNKYISVNHIIRHVTLGIYAVNRNLWEGNYTTTIVATNPIPNTSFLHSCYFGPNGSLIVDSVASSEQISNCNIRGSVTVNSILYADLEAAQIAIPTAFPNCINEDPLFVGDPSRLEFLVERSSPMIGAGLLGFNIGGVKTGSVQNATTTEFGISPLTNVNTSYVSEELQVSAGTEGRRESDTIDLGQVYNSPIIGINAILDFLNHTPDSDNVPINPNHLVFEAQWAGVDQVFNGTWEKFRFGLPMQIDVNSKYTGEDGFVASGLADLPMRYLRVAIVPRNDYNAA